MLYNYIIVEQPVNIQSKIIRHTFSKLNYLSICTVALRSILTLLEIWKTLLFNHLVTTFAEIILIASIHQYIGYNLCIAYSSFGIIE